MAEERLDFSAVGMGISGYIGGYERTLERAIKAAQAAGDAAAVSRLKATLDSFGKIGGGLGTMFTALEVGRTEADFLIANPEASPGWAALRAAVQAGVGTWAAVKIGGAVAVTVAAGTTAILGAGVVAGVASVVITGLAVVAAGYAVGTAAKLVVSIFRGLEPYNFFSQGSVEFIDEEDHVTYVGSENPDVVNAVGNTKYASIFGNESVDTLTGSRFDDIISGGAGNDILRGGFGSDKILGGLNDDTLIGGVNKFSDDDAADELIGGSGFDTYHVRNGDKVVDLDGRGQIIVDGNITLTGGVHECGEDEVPEKDRVYTGESYGETYQRQGNNLIIQFEGQSYIIENWRDDSLGLTLEDKGVEIDGTDGGDALAGGDCDDVIRGLGGSDVINGLGGNDELEGGSGNDSINGGAGDDVLKGGADKDDLFGGAGKDTLEGGDNDDHLKGEGDDDTLDGGEGKDVLEGGADFDTYYTDNGDTVRDSDGQGRVFFGGITLRGGSVAHEGDECEPSNDNKSDDDKVYTGSGGETYQKTNAGLVVKLKGNSITIKEWTEGQLGITLKDEDPSDGDDCDPPPSDFDDPLVLDLDGDGLDLIALEDSVAYFDIDRDGIKERTGWVGADDALLALDRNSNGTIDGAGELFAYGNTGSRLPGDFEGPGGLDIEFENGFEQLAKLDSNEDGIINADDAQFADLRAWQDANGDGISQSSELRGLAEVGVASISLQSESSNELINGNLVSDKGTFLRDDGTEGEISDVWFRFNQYDTKFDIPDDLDPALLDLPTLGGNGNVKPLTLAMSENIALRALVEEFVALEAFELHKAPALTERIIYEWTGVASPEQAGGRGVYADRRATEVIEQFSDTDFAQWGGSTPRPVGGSILSEQLNEILQFATVRLIAQSSLGSELFPELSFENDLFLILQDETRSDTVLQRLVENAPENVFEAIAYFQAGLRVWDMVYLSFADVEEAEDDGASYRLDVESMLSQAGINLDYQDIIAARIGGLDDDQFLTETFAGNRYDEKTPVVVAGEGNDDITLGGNHQIVYWGAGQGNDTLTTSFVAQSINQSARIKVILPNVDADDIEFIKGGSGITSSLDLLIRIVSTGETLTLRNAFPNLPSLSVALEFEDHSKLALIEVVNQLALLTESATDGSDIIVRRIESTEPMDGGAGDDILLGDHGQTGYLIGNGSGNDIIRDTADSTNSIFFGEGINLDDLMFERDGQNYINLTISIKGTDDSVRIDNQFGEDGFVIDRFVFETDGELTGRDIRSQLSLQTTGDDIVYGTSGADEFGLAGYDTSIEGNDVHRGLNGGDSYAFSRGSGQDIIEDSSSISDDGIDTIRLHYNFSDLKISNVTGSFVFLDEQTGDQLTVNRNKGTIEQYTFDDFDQLTENDLITLIELDSNNTILGAGTDDELNGTGERDTIVGLSGDDSINGFDGDDNIDGGEGADQILGGDGDDVINGGQGVDTIDGGAGNDVIRAGDRREVTSELRSNNNLSGGAGDDILYDGWKDDTLSGGDGNDLIYAGNGNDIIEGGNGDDFIVDTDGDKIIRYNLGDGHDRIFSDDSEYDDSIIQFGAGITASDLTFSFSKTTGSEQTDYFGFSDYSWALKIDVANQGSLTLSGGISDDVSGIDRLEFSDGVSLLTSSIITDLQLPTDADQLIVGDSRSSDDVLTGGAGDDILAGNSGSQTFLFNIGDDHDTIVYDNSSEFNETVLRMGAGITSEELTFSRGGDNNESLTITLDSGDTLTIENQFNTKQSTRPEANEAWYINDYIDKIIFVDEPDTELTSEFLRSVNNQTTNGDDLQVGTVLPEVLEASAGDDKLIGGMGSDTYSFSLGDGEDTIIETARSFKYRPDESGGDFGGILLDLSLLRETDTLTFGEGITPDNLKLSVVGDSVSDLLIEIEGSDDKLLIENQMLPNANWGRATKDFDNYSPGETGGPEWFLGPFEEGRPALGPDGEVSKEYWEKFTEGSFGSDYLFQAGIETFIFADGSQFTREEFAALIESVENDGDNTIVTDNNGGVLDGGAGTDRLEGGTGDDTYVLNLGAFNDTASDAGGNDKVEFGIDILAEAIAFTRTGENGDDLLIEIGGVERNSLLIEGQFSGGEGAIENFVTKDGAEFSASQIEQMLLSQASTISANVIEDYFGDDIIASREGDDRIVLRGGNDLIDGGKGRDTVVFDGQREYFEVTADGNFTIVSDLRGSGDIVRLVNVETLEFKAIETGEIEKEELVENLAPVAGEISFTGREDTTLQLRDTQILSAASDTLGDGLSLVGVDAVTGGSVALGDNGHVIFQPDADFSGPASFSYTVADSEGLEATATVIVNVAPVNDAPVVANALADQASAEDTAVNFTIPVDTFSDPDGDTLTLSAFLADGSALPTWLEFDGDAQTFSGTPPRDFNGTLDVAVKASDGALEVSDRFVLEITPVNDAPVVANSLPDQTTDGGVSFTIPADTFSDPDGDILILSASLADGSALPTWLAFDGDDLTFSGTPPQDFNGTLDVVVKASDGALEVSDTFALEITPVNDAPVVANALADQASVEDTAVNFTIPADTFSDSDGDTLTLSASLADGSALPTWLVFDDDDQTFSGTPPRDFNGTLDVVVKASDGALEVSDTFALEITPVNDAPVANDDSLAEAAMSGEALTIAAADLLGNDTDIESDAFSIVSVSSRSGNATVELDTNGNVSYLATNGFSGEDSFDYTISDGELTATATVTLTVEDETDPYEGWTTGTDGRDNLYGDWFSSNQIYGAGGNDRIYGGFRDDQLDGGSGNDRIYGGFGRDVISGGEGNDRINGGFGNDTISGGEGNDRLWGGWGQDTFVFSAGDGKDRIMDYDTGRSWGWFQSGGDNISIDIDGIDSFEDLMATASQKRGSVVFDFGNGDELVLSHTRLAALDKDAFTFF